MQFLDARACRCGQAVPDRGMLKCRFTALIQDVT